MKKKKCCISLTNDYETRDFHFHFNLLLIICTHIHWVLASKWNLYSDSLRWIPTFHLILITYLCCTHHDDDNNHEVCCVNVESRYAELQSTVENEKSNFHFSCVFLLLSPFPVVVVQHMMNTNLYRREFTCVESRVTKQKHLFSHSYSLSSGMQPSISMGFYNGNFIIEIESLHEL